MIDIIYSAIIIAWATLMAYGMIRRFLDKLK